MTLSPEELALRKDRIGASECATALGMNPWCDIVELYGRKTGAIEVEQNERMAWGHVIESAIAEKYAKDHDDVDRLVPMKSKVHKTIDWMLATPDRLVVTKGPSGAARLLQIKNVGLNMAGEWGEEGSDEIPDYVSCQVMQEMAVARSYYPEWEIKIADVAACIAGDPPRYFRVDWDPDFFELIRAANERFVLDHLRPRVPPPLDFAKEAHRAFAMRRYGREGASGEMLAGDHAARALVDMYALARDEKADAEERMEMARAALAEKIGTKDGILFDDGGKVTFKKERQKIDWEAVARGKGATDADGEAGRPEPRRVLRVFEKKAARSDG